jgi:hypothetical protein
LIEPQEFSQYFALRRLLDTSVKVNGGVMLDAASDRRRPAMLTAWLQLGSILSRQLLVRVPEDTAGSRPIIGRLNWRGLR